MQLPESDGISQYWRGDAAAKPSPSFHGSPANAGVANAQARARVHACFPCALARNVCGISSPTTKASDRP